MPELPEVEIVKCGLESLLINPEIKSIKTSAKKLRTNLNKKDLSFLKDQKILGLKRVAKYILFELKESYLISHLGMTGSWRILDEKRKHDHVFVYLTDGRVLVYHDPRRFGQFDLVFKKDFILDPRFSHLGCDPVVSENVDLKSIYRSMSSKKTAIKSYIMDQKNIVGVGNIYANEALFRSQIHPLTQTCDLSFKKFERLFLAIKQVLLDAIQAGGSTISDFRQAGGSSGYFQNQFFVYGRDQELCRKCSGLIESQPIVGRSSFWCPSCQPYSKIKVRKASGRAESTRKKTSRTY